MEMAIIFQGENDPPKLANFRQPILDLGANDKLTVCVIEKGMASGEPSVMIVSEDDQGSVVVTTSLDKFMAAASGMAAAAEKHWGWKRPEGHFTMMPPDKATQKMLLEALKKELEGWDDGED